MKKTGEKARRRTRSPAVDTASPPPHPSAEENHVKDDSSMTENPPAAEEREIARFGAWKPVTGFRSSLSRGNKRATWHDTGFPPFPPCLLLLLLLYISYEKAEKNTGGQRRDRYALDARNPFSLAARDFSSVRSRPARRLSFLATPWASRPGERRWYILSHRETSTATRPH